MFLEIICLDIVSVQRYEFLFPGCCSFWKMFQPSCRGVSSDSLFTAPLSMVLLWLSAASQLFPLFEFLVLQLGATSPSLGEVLKMFFSRSYKSSSTECSNKGQMFICLKRFFYFIYVLVSQANTKISNH